MDIQKCKEKMFRELDAIEIDIERLKINIQNIRDVLPGVQSEEDARNFDETMDVEYGLKHIRIF